MAEMSGHRLIYKGDWTFSVAKKFILNPNVSIGSKCVYLAIRSFCSHGEDSAFPSSNLLASALNINRSTVFKYVSELKGLGYLDSRQVQEKGKFAHTEFTLFDEPQSPCTKKPYTEKPCTEKPVCDKTDTKTYHKEEDLPSSIVPAHAGKVRSEKQKVAWQRKLIIDRFKNLWLSAHKEVFPDRPYQFTPSDKGQMRSFFEDLKIIPEQIIIVAVDAWKHKSSAIFSHCRNLRSVGYFLNKFNEIKAEVYDKNSQSNSRPDANSGTLNAGKASQYRGVGRVVQVPDPQRTGP